MERWMCVFAAAFLSLLISGCNEKASDQSAAIRVAIDKHLNAAMGLNLAAMDRDVKQISVNGNRASAQVEFRLKEGDARMEIAYTLERQGNDWAVLKSEPIGGGSSQPEGQAPSHSPNTEGDSLPPGHPPLN